MDLIPARPDWPSPLRPTPPALRAKRPISASASGFRGQKQEVSFGAGYAFTEEAGPGLVYKYRFNTGELKKPLQDAATSNGWAYKGVQKL